MSTPGQRADGNGGVGWVELSVPNDTVLRLTPPGRSIRLADWLTEVEAAFEAGDRERGLALVRDLREVTGGR